MIEMNKKAASSFVWQDKCFTRVACCLRRLYGVADAGGPFAAARGGRHARALPKEEKEACVTLASACCNIHTPSPHFHHLYNVHTVLYGPLLHPGPNAYNTCDVRAV